ncbi:MAG: hypothetical protein O8C64_13835 [Candidatus Methanoperedens sp.]|nr:hypothetical protein [Candidatus Methanoperedens sp.]MCZ7406549.1 hypothetical protein [Candidatus Methanoperedens sp.]
MDENDKELIMEIKKQNKIIILIMFSILFILSVFTVVVLTNNNNLIKDSDPLSSTDENQSDVNNLSLSDDKNYETLYKKLIPSGTPKYSGKLGLSFDDSDKSLQTLVDFDESFDMNKLNKGQKDKYIWATTRISCEFCCDAKAITFENGEPACACIHSIAMRGLAKYLVYNYNESYSQEMVLAELTQWKARFFSSETIQKYAKENGIVLKAPTTGASCDTTAVSNTKLESSAAHSSAASCGTAQGSNIHQQSSQPGKAAPSTSCNPVASLKVQNELPSLKSSYSNPTESRLSIHLRKEPTKTGESDKLNSIYDFFGVGTQSKTSKNVINRIDLKIEDLSSLENDTNFQENLAYARTKGYIYPKSIQKTIYSDGSYSVDLILSSKDTTDFILVSRSIEKGTYLIKLEKDGNISIFNKDGGVKLNSNGSTSSWNNHFSCSFSDCELACVTKKFVNPWEGLEGKAYVQRFLTDAAASCTKAGGNVGEYFNKLYDATQDVECVNTCQNSNTNNPDTIGDCIRCAIGRTAGRVPAAACVLTLWSTLGDQLKP